MKANRLGIRLCWQIVDVFIFNYIEGGYVISLPRFRRLTNKTQFRQEKAAGITHFFLESVIIESF